MIKIVADEKIPFLKGVLEPYASLEYLPGKAIDRNVLRDADALLIRTNTTCDKELLEGTAVRFIGSATVGFDHIDTEYCERRRIRWVNAPGCNASSVQQYICSSLLAIAASSGFSLKGKTLGIIGVGNIGRLVERLGLILGMQVLLNDPPRERKEGSDKFVPLETLAGSSDIITLHVPLNKTGPDKTVHLIGRESFRRMKRGAWLINTARGEVLDGAALREEISVKQAPGLVLDVWENEPEINATLLPDVFITTPHIAGYSVEGKSAATSRIVRELGSYFGIPTQNWSPADLPQADNPVLSLDGSDLTDEELVAKAVRHTYNIWNDDRQFRKNPSCFEKQRGNYPVRREFPSYILNLSHASPEAAGILESLGFVIRMT
jgi:erythronate-4-phosphate dehydrogenase